MFHSLLQLPAVNPEKIAEADSVAKAKFMTNLKELSGMSFEEVLQRLITGTIEVILKIAIAFAIYYAGRWLIKRILKLISRIFDKRHAEVSLRNFVLNVVKVILMIFLLIAIVGVLGINTTSIVAIFASASLAIGMALSGTMQNFAGGVMILMLKPYRIGDYIEAQGQAGTVKEIRLFNTVLNTPDNKTIIVPNSSISTSIVNNYSQEPNRRVDWTFSIAYGDDYDRAKNLLAELLAKDERILKNPAPFIALQALGASSVDIVVRAWTTNAAYWGVFFDMNEKVYKIFPEQGLNIPFPQMDVHIHQ